jgi:hypothetical protein
VNEISLSNAERMMFSSIGGDCRSAMSPTLEG